MSPMNPAADFNDHHIRGIGDQGDGLLDLVGNMGNDLNSAAQILALAAPW